MAEVTRHLKRRFFGQAYQTSMQALLLQRNRVIDSADPREASEKKLLGYKVPAWQRPVVWSDAQSIRFIESIWLGVAMSPFMVNDSLDPELSLVLLDGQQRLTAIDRYWAGQIAVQGEDGNHYLWTDLTLAEQMHFLRIPFPWLETHYESETDLRAAYDRHNFGGTNHTPDQAAGEIRSYSAKLTPEQNQAFAQYESLCGMPPYGIDEFEAGDIDAYGLWQKNVRWIEDVCSGISNISFPAERGL